MILRKNNVCMPHPWPPEKWKPNLHGPGQANSRTVTSQGWQKRWWKSSPAHWPKPLSMQCHQGFPINAHTIQEEDLFKGVKTWVIRKHQKVIPGPALQRQVPPPGERRAQLVAGGPCPPGRTSTGQVGGEPSLPQTHMEYGPTARFLQWKREGRVVATAIYSQELQSSPH